MRMLLRSIPGIWREPGAHEMTTPQKNVSRKCTYAFYLAAFTAASLLCAARGTLSRTACLSLKRLDAGNPPPGCGHSVVMVRRLRREQWLSISEGKSIA